MFFIITLSFLSGVALHSFADFDLFYLYILMLAAAIMHMFNRQNIKIRYIALAAVFLFLGFFRFDISQVDVRTVKPDHIAYYNGQELEIRGVIIDEPDVREESVKYTIGEIRLAPAQSVKGRLLVTTRLYPRLLFGDFVSLRCKLKQPEEFNGFAYDKYLAKAKIYSLCYYPTIKQINTDVERISANASIAVKIKQQIFKLKNNFIVQISKILPSPHSALLSGLLLGDTAGMPDYLKQKFIDTGVVHIVAISGYNITIIISLFLSLAPYLYLSRRRSWILILPSLAVFVIITGAESSVVRAAIMGVIAALAGESGRLSDVKRLLLITAVIMVIVNPYVLRFDAGFQLSFLATLGLIYITPRLEQGVNWFIENSLFRFPSFMVTIGTIIRESAVTTIGANIAVAPLLLLQFGRISLISPVVNILILWIIPAIMSVGFIAVMASYLLLHGGQFLGWFVWIMLEYVIEIVKLF
ncbi:MAG: ComEC/Rec2 family competence protein [Patescibacteria group bacterium]